MHDSPWKQENCYSVSWEVLGFCLSELRERMINDRLTPTIVIGISRGGLIPATYFANAMQGAQFVAMGISRNRTEEIYSEKKPPELGWISPGTRFNGESILLVDDVTSSGETLKFAHDLLAEHGPKRIWTAAVVRMERSSFVPDYVGVVLDDWVVFPWETPEPSRTLVTIGREQVLRTQNSEAQSHSPALQEGDN